MKDEVKALTSSFILSCIPSLTDWLLPLWCRRGRRLGRVCLLLIPAPTLNLPAVVQDVLPERVDALAVGRVCAHQKVVAFEFQRAVLERLLQRAEVALDVDLKVRGQMHDLVADCRALYARKGLQLQRKLFKELARAVDGTPADDDCAHVPVCRLEEDFERVVRFQGASEDEEVAEAVRLDAPDGLQAEAARGVCRDHSEDLLVADNRADGLGVEAHELGLLPEMFRAARTPVRADGDVDAFRDERLYVERVAVEE